MVRLTVTHDQLEAGSDMLKGITQGWPKVLSSLKSLMESGTALPRLWGLCTLGRLRDGSAPHGRTPI